jgi:hypothetical protein
MCDPATLGIISAVGSAASSIMPIFGGMGGGQQQQQSPYQQDTYEPAQNQQNESGMSPEAMRQAERDRKMIAAQQGNAKGMQPYEQQASLLTGQQPYAGPSYKEDLDATLLGWKPKVGDYREFG